MEENMDKLIEVDKPAPHILLRWYLPEYTEGPDYLYIHLNTAFIGKVLECRHVMYVNPHIFTSITSHIVVDVPNCSAVSIAEDNIQNPLDTTYEHKFIKEPPTSLLEELNRKETEDNDYVEYLNLHVYVHDFSIKGYLKYAGSSVEASSIGDNILFPQKVLK